MWLRRTSWLFATRCLTVAITCLLCTPRISAAACAPVRYGSSLKVSGARPHRGSRRMFTVGMSAMLWPLPACSAPYALPYADASEVSHVEASAEVSAHCVTPVDPLPTPTGESARYRAGMPRRVLAGTTPAWPAALSGSGYPAPCTMAIFSSSVICATRRRARWSPARRVFIQGRAVPPADTAAGAEDARGAAAAPGMVPRHATATTTPLTTLMALTFMAAPGRETAERHRARGWPRQIRAERAPAAGQCRQKGQRGH